MEIDETYVLESQKGARSVSSHLPIVMAMKYIRQREQGGHQQRILMKDSKMKSNANQRCT